MVGSDGEADDRDLLLHAVLFVALVDRLASWIDGGTRLTFKNFNETSGAIPGDVLRSREG